MRKFYIHTMGCKSNQFEGVVIIENLLKNGMKQAAKLEEADIFVLNSCTVTHKSDNEAFYLLRNAKSKNPRIINILTGCIAQVEKEKLLENDFVDCVVGNDEKLRLYEFLENKCSAGNIMECVQFTSVPAAAAQKTRASIKIQDGCDNRCSYCIIPFARGKSRSAGADFILEQIEDLSAQGFKEVVLTGIHIGQWGRDLYCDDRHNIPRRTCPAPPVLRMCSVKHYAGHLSLLDLLKLIETTSIPRYRLGSLNPLEISGEMLEFLAGSQKFCPHFHLSLQSACDKTLKSMNRRYTVEAELTLIEKINAKFERAAGVASGTIPPFIGSDIITGFAGETEEDFETTRQNLERSGLTQIHVFPYSPRAGTAGARLPGQLPEKVRNERAKIIREISVRKHREFCVRNAGTVQEVLVEKSGKKGITRNYLTVALEGKYPPNTLQMIKIPSFMSPTK